MTTAVQHRRGTTAEHAAFTGLEGELTIDTTKDTAVIHDGTLAGGYPLAKENLANVTTSGLSSIDGASTASDDKFFIYDQSATSLKTITRAELNNAIEQDTLANVAITGGTINGTTIGGTTAAAVSSTTLTTSSTVTHNGGTANSVCFLNGSKVLTTGSALTFDGTSLVNRVAANASLQLGLSVTNATNADFNVRVANNLTDLQVSSATPLSFTLGASEQMRLTSTGLGIGTSSPGAKLTIAQSSNVITQGLLLVNAAGTQNGGWYHGGSALIGRENGVDTIALAAGNVGIGTSSPGEKLEVKSSSAMVKINSTASFAQLGYYNNGTFLWNAYADFTSSEYRLGNSGGTQLTLSSAGNLGLGVTPSAWDTIKPIEIARAGSFVGANSSGSTYLGTNTRYSGGSWRYANDGAAGLYTVEDNIHFWRTAPSGTAGNAISFSQAMTLTAAGDLLVGTTAQNYSGKQELTFTTGRGLVIDYTTSTGAAAAVYFRNSGGNVGEITISGTTTTYATSSDYRLKNITGPITTSGAYIDSLNPVEGTWKADGSTFVGLIAHEVQEASRTTVATGVKDGEQMQGMDYSSAEIIANLIAEVKSLRQRLAAAGI